MDEVLAALVGCGMRGAGLELTQGPLPVPVLDSAQCAPTLGDDRQGRCQRGFNAVDTVLPAHQGLRQIPGKHLNLASFVNKSSKTRIPSSLGL